MSEFQPRVENRNGSNWMMSRSTDNCFESKGGVESVVGKSEVSGVIWEKFKFRSKRTTKEGWRNWWTKSKLWFSSRTLASVMSFYGFGSEWGKRENESPRGCVNLFYLRESRQLWAWGLVSNWPQQIRRGVVLSGSWTLGVGRFSPFPQTIVRLYFQFH